MVNIENIVKIEHLAVAARFSLRDFCARFRLALSLPAFAFDCENDTEWGCVRVDGIEYNVSRPYETGTLQSWDETVPDGCDFGISLCVLRGHPQAEDDVWIDTHLVVRAGEALARELKMEVFRHRTWLGVGNNVQRKRVFRP